MTERKLTQYIFIILLIFSQNSFAVEKKKPQIQGTIYKTTENHKTVVRYDIVFLHAQIDSAFISVSSYRNLRLLQPNNTFDTLSLNIYKISDTLQNEHKNQKIDLSNDRLHIKGKIIIHPDDSHTNEIYYGISGCYTDDSGNVAYLYESSDETNIWFGIGMSLIYPGYGYYKNKDYSTSKLLITWGFSLELNSGNWRGQISTHLTEGRKKYVLSEPFRFELRYYLSRYKNYCPQIYGGLKKNTFKYDIDSIQNQFEEMTFDIGIASETTFGRIGYQFTDFQNGYHAIEFFSPIVAGIPGKFGTRYLFRFNKHFWDLGIAFHLENIDLNDIDHNERRRLGAYDNRNFLLKALSYGAAVPYLPFYGIYKLFKKN